MQDMYTANKSPTIGGQSQSQSQATLGGPIMGGMGGGPATFGSPERTGGGITPGNNNSSY